ncbi:helix-turn-helix domain-containing protein [Allocoleopsis sp.]|uniref:helix-turn-helix domain-containing protein n=1 Tax=Allocoleopsis sp. TaxID=3088169 RepID=UPI0039C8A103
MIQPCQINVSQLPSIPFVWCKSLPSASGIYIALSEDDQVLYVGQSGNMRMRWRSHHKRTALIAHNCSKLCWIDVSDTSLLAGIEKALIEWFKPPLNKESKLPVPSEQVENTPLIRLRESLGMTQRELGNAIGVTDQTISNWERSTHSPRLTLEQWANLCDVSKRSPRELADLLK